MAPSLLVLFASETGNSEAIAKRVHDEAGKNGFDSTLAALNEWQKVGFEQGASLVVVVTSTTGNGDPPRNGDKFFRFIKNRTNPANLLMRVSYRTSRRGAVRRGVRRALAAFARAAPGPGQDSSRPLTH
jgi:sulfite reductase alpha subunit-like flavoprotein